MTKEGKIVDAKIKISMWLDGDVIKAVKNAAKAGNTKYTALINKTLREVFLEEKPVQSQLDELCERVRKLEAQA